MCNKTYDPKTMSFKFTGPPHCNKPITKASVKKARVNNKRLEAAARSRPGQSGGGGENGPNEAFVSSLILPFHLRKQP